MSALLVPFFAYIVDHHGNRITLLILSSLLIIISHLLLALSSMSPILPMVLLGLSYAIFGVSIWPWFVHDL